MDRQRGITLLELMTAIAVLAVLGALATPALEQVVLNARRAAAVEEVLRAAWLARTEAVRRGRPVLLCASGGGNLCLADTGAWSGGWLVRPLDDPAEILRRGRGATDPRARLLSNRSVFRFEPHDRRSTNGTLAWCDSRGAGAARAVVIAPTGRPRPQHGPGSLACPPPP